MNFAEERFTLPRPRGMRTLFPTTSRFQMKYILPCVLGAVCFASPLGTFDAASSVTRTTNSGHAEFNDANREYTITGAGGELGGTSVGFHYVWKRITGDVVINADARFTGSAVSDQSQAALMIRQSLDPDAVY